MENQVDLDLEKKLQELQKQLSKKNLFEEAVTSIRSLLQKHYPSASLSLQKSVRFLFIIPSLIVQLMLCVFFPPKLWLWLLWNCAFEYLCIDYYVNELFFYFIFIFG